MRMGMGMEMRPQLTLKQQMELKLKPPRVGGIHGTLVNLCKILNKYPQQSGKKVNYVLAGGWAVELVTGYSRSHKDIDIILLNPNFNAETDNQRPESYFGQLSISRGTFYNHCISSIFTKLPIHYPKGWKLNEFRVEMKKFCDPLGEVWIAQPELLAIAKLSGGWGGEIGRDKDIEDCVSLLRKVPNCAIPIMSQPISQLAFKNLIGFPASQVEDLTQDFLRLNHEIFNTRSETAAEKKVREFHDKLRDLVGPNREGNTIERW